MGARAQTPPPAFRPILPKILIVLIIYIPFFHCSSSERRLIFEIHLLKGNLVLALAEANALKSLPINRLIVLIG